jgi:O-acetyl-ADP-ribose deacetylase (regulator of RNase III)
MPNPLLTATAGSARLEIAVADITTLEVGAIVNAANTSLLGGGGVDGAIHRAAGRRLLEECETPVWHGGNRGEPELLASCYRTALNLAVAQSLSSIAFPAISTGVYRFPAELAARIAVGTVASELAADARGTERVVFCCFSNESAQHHKNAFAELGLA